MTAAREGHRRYAGQAQKTFLYGLTGLTRMADIRSGRMLSEPTTGIMPAKRFSGSERSLIQRKLEKRSSMALRNTVKSAMKTGI